MSSCWVDSVKGLASESHHIVPGSKRISVCVPCGVENLRRFLVKDPADPEKVRPSAGRLCCGSTVQNSNVPQCFGPAA